MNLHKKLSIILLSLSMLFNTGMTVFAEETEEGGTEEITETVVQEETAEENEEQPSEETETEPVEETEEEFFEEEEEAVIDEESEKYYFDVNDFETPAVGTDGVVYEGVTYLSVGAVSRLDEEGQTLYRGFADDIASRISNGQELTDVVIAVSKEGELLCGYTLSERTIAGYAAAFTHPEGESEEPAEILTEEPEETETPEIAEQEEEEVLPVEEVPEEEIAAEETEAPAETEEPTDTEEITPVETETPEVTEPAEGEPEEIVPAEETPEEENIPEETEEPEEITDAAEEIEGTFEIVEENMDLYEMFSMPVEDVIEGEDEEIDTILQDMNFYYDQLNSSEKSMFKKGKTAFVNKGKTGFSFSSSYSSLYTKAYDSVRAASALVMTYPNKFEWHNRPGGWRVSYRGTYSSLSCKLTLAKSKYYSKKLYNQAKAKVNEIVDAAYTYAASNYRNNPAYGIIKYFDQWLCNNNYYNNNGTYSSYQNTAEYYYCHTAFGTLLMGYGVCESYALAMNWLLDTAGIRSMYVVGDVPGGGHAWNYIQMTDGKWYLQDSTWNDSLGNKTYLLQNPSYDDNSRKPTGDQFGTDDVLQFDKTYWATSAYSSTATDTYFSKITLSETQKYLAPKKSFTLTKNLPTVGRIGSYYEKWPVTWTSSNPKVAKVSSKGKVTAVSPGSATITMTIGGQKKTCTVYVYKVSKLTFTDNAKTKYTKVYEKNSNVSVVNNVISAVFNTSDVQTIYLDVNQVNQTRTAAQLTAYAGLKVTAKSSKPSIAEVSDVSVSGNQIVLRVKPNKIGKTTITVKYGGKKAKLTFSTGYKVQAGWFDRSSLSSTFTYNGKAQKPKIIKSANAPKDLKYKVKYTNNKNAGTATVSIVGTGKYAGTLNYSFTIRAKSIIDVKISSVKAPKTAGANPTATVKDGKTTLKQGVDYRFQYSRTGTSGWSATIPTVTSGSPIYVRVTGIGNYTGTSTAVGSYKAK